MTQQDTPKSHFISKIIDDDLDSGKHKKIITRFPPEPNGYLHIGHAKAICLNFTIAEQYQGTCHLRFDDTNPTNQYDKYVTAIQDDIKWLGFDWQQHLYYSSDYFDQLYDLAKQLIQQGDAYVDSLSFDEMREYRGTLTEAGKASPDRDRSIAESLALFERMYQGDFNKGEYTLRAKIDMSSGNINMRDPVIFRILPTNHPHTGKTWHIFPTYDFTHSLSDSIEAITHSLCSLEFQDHRPLYDWFINRCAMPNTPRQIEFSRLNLNYTITSKRKLKQLVDGQYVDGWDDPRMPTLSGMRRRGYPAVAIRNFCDSIGISKQDSIIDYSLLEEAVRTELNTTAHRKMAVIDPIKVVITNYPNDEGETIEVSNHPQNPELGTRELTFSKEIYIDADDFMLDPPNKFFRLSPGKEVRLRNAYVIQCDEVLYHEDGTIKELHCTYDPNTLGGKKPLDGRKVKGIIHWVSANTAIDASVYLYDKLFTIANPGAEDHFESTINPESLVIMKHAKLEPSLAHATISEPFQFTRLGYFCLDKNSDKNALIFNRITSLKADKSK